MPHYMLWVFAKAARKLSQYLAADLGGINTRHAFLPDYQTLLLREWRFFATSEME